MGSNVSSSAKIHPMAQISEERVSSNGKKITKVIRQIQIDEVIHTELTHNLQKLMCMFQLQHNFITMNRINSTYMYMYGVDASMLVHISTVSAQTTCVHCQKAHHSTPDTMYL